MFMELLLSLLLLFAFGAAAYTAVYMVYSLILLVLEARKQKRERVQRINQNVYRSNTTEMIRYSLINVDKQIVDLTEHLKDDKREQIAIASNESMTNTNSIKVEIAPYVYSVIKEINNKKFDELQELLSTINKEDKFESSDNQLRGAMK